MTMVSEAVFVFYSLVAVVSCQVFTMTWLNGDDMANTPSTVFVPGARSGSLSWKDANGHVWVFGGRGYSNLNNGKLMLMNDLWRYDIHNNLWSLVHPGSVSSTGNSSYFKAPSPRYLGAACGVTNITFVIYGGLGENDKALKDTWVYYFKRQTWLLVDGYVHLDLDLSDENNTTVDALNSTVLEMNETENHRRPRDMLNASMSPGERANMAAWCLYDSMIIFSGRDNDKNLLSDMWKMSFKTLEWEEIIVSNVSLAPRTGATTWVDKEQTLYIFGGNTVFNSKELHSTVGYVSDLWAFNQTDVRWQHMSGTTEPQKPGIYSERFSRHSYNIPGSRQGASAWLDSEDNLWLFGGDGLDAQNHDAFSQSKLLSDFWRFDPKSHEWSWMAGSEIGEAGVKFSKKGEVSTEALIGGRCDASSWQVRGNKFYIFGGLGHDNHQRDGYLNDLWMVDMERLVHQSASMKLTTIVLFVLLVVSLILILVAFSLYARDRSSSSFNRFNSDFKYTHLSTTGD